MIYRNFHVKFDLTRFCISWDLGVQTDTFSKLTYLATYAYASLSEIAAAQTNCDSSADLPSNLEPFALWLKV